MIVTNIRSPQRSQLSRFPAVASDTRSFITVATGVGLSPGVATNIRSSSAVVNSGGSLPVIRTDGVSPPVILPSHDKEVTSDDEEKPDQAYALSDPAVPSLMRPSFPTFIREVPSAVFDQATMRDTQNHLSLWISIQQNAVEDCDRLGTCASFSDPSK